LGFSQIVEAPAYFVDSNSKRSAVFLEVLFRQLNNWHDFAVTNQLPETVNMVNFLDSGCSFGRQKAAELPWYPHSRDSRSSLINAMGSTMQVDGELGNPGVFW
jgi:hypothetical protein